MRELNALAIFEELSTELASGRLNCLRSWLIIADELLDASSKHSEAAHGVITRLSTENLFFTGLIALFVSHNPNEARAIFTELAQSNHANSNFLLGWLAEHYDKNFAAAKAFYETALTQANPSPEIHYALALVCAKLMNSEPNQDDRDRLFEESEQQFDLALAANLPEALNFLAVDAENKKPTEVSEESDEDVELQAHDEQPDEKPSTLLRRAIEQYYPYAFYNLFLIKSKKNPKDPELPMLLKNAAALGLTREFQCMGEACAQQQEKNPQHGEYLANKAHFYFSGALRLDLKSSLEFITKLPPSPRLTKVIARLANSRMKTAPEQALYLYEALLKSIPKANTENLLPLQIEADIQFAQRCMGSKGAFKYLELIWDDVLAGTWNPRPELLKWLALQINFKERIIDKIRCHPDPNQQTALVAQVLNHRNTPLAAIFWTQRGATAPELGKGSLQKLAQFRDESLLLREEPAEAQEPESEQTDDNEGIMLAELHAEPSIAQEYPTLVIAPKIEVKHALFAAITNELLDGNQNRLEIWVALYNELNPKPELPRSNNANFRGLVAFFIEHNAKPAIELFDTLRRNTSNPNYLNAVTNRAYIYLASNDLTNAAEFLDFAAARGHSGAKYKLAELIRTNKITERQLEYPDLVKEAQEAGHPLALLLMANDAYNDKEYGKSLALYETAKEAGAEDDALFGRLMIFFADSDLLFEKVDTTSAFNQYLIAVMAKILRNDWHPQEATLLWLSAEKQLVFNHISQKKQLGLFKRALDPSDPLGKIFWIQRGFFKPSLKYGYLAAINKQAEKLRKSAELQRELDYAFEKITHPDWQETGEDTSLKPADILAISQHLRGLFQAVVKQDQSIQLNFFSQFVDIGCDPKEPAHLVAGLAKRRQTLLSCLAGTGITAEKIIQRAQGILTQLPHQSPEENFGAAAGPGVFQGTALKRARARNAARQAQTNSLGV